MRATKIYYPVLFLAILFSASHESVHAQGTTEMPSPGWTKVTSKAGDFSIAIPKDHWIMDKAEEVSSIIRSVYDSSITVSFEARSGAKKEFARRWELRRIDDEMKVERYKTGDFLIEQYLGRKDQEREYPSIYFHLASSKGLYTVSVTDRTPNSEIMKQVLGSIELAGVPLYGRHPRPSATRSFSAVSITADDIVINAVKQPDSKQDSLSRSADRYIAADWDEIEQAQPKNLTRGLIVLRKFKASYTDDARRKMVNGNVILSVTFGSDGNIGNIVLLESLDKGLDRKAFEVAKKIKFLPQMVDGQPVDAVRRVIYSFNVY